MKQILDKINDIIHDINNDMLDKNTAIIFFKGYLIAMYDLNIIDNIERRYLIRFLEKLLDK